LSCCCCYCCSFIPVSSSTHRCCLSTRLPSTYIPQQLCTRHKHVPHLLWQHVVLEYLHRSCDSPTCISMSYTNCCSRHTPATAACSINPL
jgi:hypothetical protein